MAGTAEKVLEYMLDTRIDEFLNENDDNGTAKKIVTWNLETGILLSRRSVGRLPPDIRTVHNDRKSL